ncbi:hypothetical protein HOC01_00140 [archaeon]|jgi:nanoRNase/pAp phosphatase (c-di-AMP/oligoRNAs hydrolase)|nr:hypothetical protein [archaeon]MBT6698750.1 hypothetical protein [archaeon]
MLTPKQVKTLRTAIENSQSPLFIHDDDPDGLCAFLLLYDIKREGKALMLKAAPKLDTRFLRKIEHLSYDSLFILDVPQVEQDFIDQIKTPIYWIDHHGPERPKKANYFNPKLNNPDGYFPTTYCAWQINPNKDKMWLAMAGCLADWCLPDFTKDFQKKYPKLLKKSQTKDIGTAFFKSKIGIISVLLFFMYKGSNNDVQKRLSVMRQISGPEEILDQTTPKGKFLWKHYAKTNKAYEYHITKASTCKTKSKLLIYNYIDSRFSFTSILANQLQWLHKNKVILITRKSDGKYKCSLRAQFPIVDALKDALEGLEGYGGGHPTACGAVVAEIDWEHFIRKFEENIVKSWPKKTIKKIEKKETTKTGPQSGTDLGTGTVSKKSISKKIKKISTKKPKIKKTKKIDSK